MPSDKRGRKKERGAVAGQATLRRVKKGKKEKRNVSLQPTSQEKMTGQSKRDGGENDFLLHPQPEGEKDTWRAGRLPSEGGRKKEKKGGGPRGCNPLAWEYWLEGEEESERGFAEF